MYAIGNKAGKPVGSGYYIVSLNAGQCAAKKAGAYGCKFDTDGNRGDCRGGELGPRHPRSVLNANQGLVSDQHETRLEPNFPARGITRLQPDQA